MGFRKTVYVLPILVSSLVVGLPAAAHAAAHARWQNVTYDGVRLQVPAGWPVVNLARHPADCPDLGRHAVYLGEPGPDPSCPPDLHGKTENAWIHRANPA